MAERDKDDLAQIDEMEVDELTDEDLEDAAGGIADDSSGLLCCSLIACDDAEAV